jgi:hypothetical protein
MWFRSVFHNLVARSAGTPPRKRRPAPNVRQRPVRCRLRVEVLEDRTLPSTLTVTSLADSGTGSLRAEITAAQSGDTIDFAAGLTGTINLQSPLPALNANVDIQGPGAGQMTVEGEGFTVGSAANVQISGLTVADAPTAIDNGGTLALNSCTVTDNVAGLDNTGVATVNNSTLSGNYNTSDGGAIYNLGDLTVNNSTICNNTVLQDQWPLNSDGGGIYNDGNLTVNSSTISNNSAQCYTTGFSGYAVQAGTGSGGGIYTAGGTLSINSSTIAGNKAVGGDSYYSTYPGDAFGGGLFIGGGTVAINNSTFADNQASAGVNLSGGGSQETYEFGGGLYIGGGTVSIDYSTLAGNQALGYPGYGGGIDNAAPAGALQMYDTILADNSAYEFGSLGDGPDLYGSVTSLGYNLIGNSTGGSGFAATDLLNVNPQLGPLQNNGGPTQTMALLPGSPAINAGDPSDNTNPNTPAYDQRGPGYARIVGGTIDIGAFEVQSGTSTQSISLVVSGPTSTTAGNAGTFTVTADYANGTIDTGYSGTVAITSSDGQAVLPADVTISNGTAQFSATLKTAGTQSLTATDTTTSTITGSDTGITVAPASASKLVVAGFPSSTTAGQAGTFTVTAYDAYGNVATGYTGTVQFSSTDTKALLPAAATLTNGTGQFSATLKTAGTQSLTVTDGSGLTATEAGITVLPGVASQFLLTAPATVNPGVPFSLTLTVEDAYGNVATGYTGTVQFSSTDRKAKLPANYTFTTANKGTHTFTGVVLRTKGNQKITVTAGSLTGSVIVDVL